MHKEFCSDSVIQAYLDGEIGREDAVGSLHLLRLPTGIVAALEYQDERAGYFRLADGRVEPIRYEALEGISMPSDKERREWFMNRCVSVKAPVPA